MNQVRMYHPTLDAHVYVPESAVAIHRVSGWVPADEHVPRTDAHVAPVEEKAAVAEEKKSTKAVTRRSQAEEQ